MVINLGSSSLKAALVDSTGAFLWHSGRSIAADEHLEEVLQQWLEPELEPEPTNIQGWRQKEKVSCDGCVLKDMDPFLDEETIICLETLLMFMRPGYSSSVG